MKTYIQFWKNLIQFFLEWKTAQTKVVKEIRTHILCSITFFFLILPLWDNLEKYCTAGEATDDNIWRMRIACWIPKATDTLRICNNSFFHCSNVCANMPQCYTISTLPVLFLPKQNLVYLSTRLQIQSAALESQPTNTSSLLSTWRNRREECDGLGMWRVWVRRGGCTGSWWGNRREGDHWVDLRVDGRISRKWDVGIWTGLGWPRIETGGGRLWVR